MDVRPRSDKGGALGEEARLAGRLLDGKGCD